MNPLRAIGWPCPDTPAHAHWRTLLQTHPRAQPARIIEQHRSGYRVATGPHHSMPAISLPEWQRPRCPPEQRGAVGDWVLVEMGAEGAHIVALLPRLRAIKRGAAGEHYKQQVIAANIDTVLVVCGLDADFNPRRIERYLLMIAGSGATPVVVLTKADRPDADIGAALDALAPIAAQGVAIVPVNAKDPQCNAKLAEWLQPGSTAVLVGSSGAGKSTLTNTLVGDPRMKTSAVREHDARGRHTTTYRALIALPTGACLIDTPGMRELKPTGEEDVEQSFAEIDALADACRFRDCRHASEPGCAVRAALQAGSLDPRRYANYSKLRDEVLQAADQLSAQSADKASARIQDKTLHKRLDDKYGRHR